MHITGVSPECQAIEDEYSLHEQVYDTKEECEWVIQWLAKQMNLPAPYLEIKERSTTRQYGRYTMSLQLITLWPLGMTMATILHEFAHHRRNVKYQTKPKKPHDSTFHYNHRFVLSYVKELMLAGG